MKGQKELDTEQVASLMSQCNDAEQKLSDIQYQEKRRKLCDEVFDGDIKDITKWHAKLNKIVEALYNYGEREMDSERNKSRTQRRT